jgi:4-aminobutyrate aminotransferase-like enzyme
LNVGKEIRKGSRIGSIGDITVNGGWPPHLHFQVITDLLGLEGDFPGVAPPSLRSVWLSLCPDPGLLLGLPDDSLPARPASADEIHRARRVHIGPNLSLSYRRPLHIVRGYMQHLYDQDGQRYLDAVNNVPHVGHCHPDVVRAARAQAGILNTNTRYLHANLVRYAEKLCATLPEPLRVCYFVCSGSEANDLALRLAFAHTRGRDVIVVDGGYYGNSSSLVEISPHKFDGPGGHGSPPHVRKVPMPDCYRGPIRANAPDCGAKYAEFVGQALESIRASGRKPAAFICESALGCGGQIILPDGYLAAAYRHVRARGAVCIADEVQVGFGRLGVDFWGFATQGVVPDIVTLGKPIGNGHPLAAVVTTPELAASFDNGMEYFNTFGGNPVSCAVGMTVLEVIEREQLQENALRVGSHLKAGLESLKNRHGWIGDVRGLGLFIGVEMVRSRETLEPAAEEASYAVERMKEVGVLTSTDGPHHNVIKIKPPLVFTESDADTLVAALERALLELT